MAVVESAEATEVVTPVRPRRSTRQQGRAWHGRALHTCARLRFEYAADSGSTVYELPDQAALDACDFTSATLLCDENAGNPCDILFDYDREHTVHLGL